MTDFGCHRLEVLLHLFGPVARRHERRRRTSRSTATVEDTAAALLQFERGAVRGSSRSRNAAADRQDTLEVFGTRGSIRVASLNAGDFAVRIGDEERVESHPPAANVHVPLVDDFVDAVLNGPRSGGRRRRRPRRRRHPGRHLC